jgi:hypothetical protein
MPGAGPAPGADGGDGHRFLVRGVPTVILSPTAKPSAADFDIGRAGARIRREIGLARLRADARDRDGLDPMADAVDVQPDLVADRDVGDDVTLMLVAPAGASAPR